MPEHPNPKEREHPWHHLKGSVPSSTSSLSHSVTPSLSYADLHVTTNFTFLTGASHPEELIQRAATLGHAAAAITDINSLAGVVRAHVAAKEVGIPLAVGTRIELSTESEAPPSSTSSLRHSVTLSLLLFPTSRPAYAQLCRLLTTGKRRAPKGQCFLSLDDVIEHSDGMLAVLLPPTALDDDFLHVAERLRGVFATDDRLSLAACRRFGPDDESRLRELADLADHTRIPLVATSDIHYHIPGRRALQDVLTCIRHRCTIDQAGLRLLPHAEYHTKPPDEMARLFASHEWGARAVARAAAVALRAAAGFNLDQLRYEYPDEVIPPNTTAMQHLTELTWQCARKRYPAGVPPKVSSQILHELRLIDELAYAHYFLTVHDLVVHARSLSILCQGRGAAANSAVCYCLGVTSVDPDRIDMLFERFVSKERNEPPDIDIDFEHERREEVIQYIYAKYGRDRAALTAEVITYRGRSAIRDVGKALGLSLDCVDTMAKSLDWWERVAGITREQRADGKPEKRTTAFATRLLELGLSPDDPTLEKVLDLVGQLVGFPRHLSQHVGGFVMTKGPLCESVPIENAAMENRTVIEWDKDDIDALGMLKVDVLGLGMLTAIRRAFDFVNRSAALRPERAIERSHGWSDAAPGVAQPVETESDRSFRPEGADEGQRPSPGIDNSSAPSGREDLDDDRPRVPVAAATSTRGYDRSPLRGGEVSAPTAPLELHTIPPEDPAVYDMICAADTIGVFQIESRAQMTMLPRLRPRCFYDLVIEVAIVRPGPIQGNMVHPYLRRRNKEEPVTYPNEAVKRVLAKTLGIPLFQEQAMQLAIVAAGFTPGEADQLRRAIAAWKSKPNSIMAFGEKLVGGMLARGYSPDFAHRCFEQIKGFSGYGFPESHAASFALLVYVSSWLKKYHPAAFAAALINSQPMGFYAPAQIVRDAKEHGAPVRPIDVNHSGWDCTLEESDEVTKGRSDEVGNGTDAGVPAHSAISPVLRLGMRLVRGLNELEARAIEDAVKRRGPFTSIESLWQATGVKVASLRRLAQADAFNSMHLNRQAALWHIRALHDEPLPIFDASAPPLISSLGHSVTPSLPSIPPPRQVVHDYAATGLSLKAHPISFMRPQLAARAVTPAAELRDGASWPTGQPIVVAGLVLVRQRPATASGIVFMTIEDETGIANLIIRPKVYEKYRKAARHSIVILARGHIERQREVIHVLVTSVEDIRDAGITLAPMSRDFH